MDFVSLLIDGIQLLILICVYFAEGPTNHVEVRSKWKTGNPVSHPKVDTVSRIQTDDLPFAGHMLYLRITVSEHPALSEPDALFPSLGIDRRS